jgi:acyl-CoA thioesterase-2
MHASLRELIRILDIETIEQNLFRGHHPEGTRGRVLGGQIMAQALMAAGRTIDEPRPPHSLHGYFLRPGDSDLPVLLSVDRIRDGRSFTTRRVAAIQHGRAIFELSASFQLAEPGLEHAPPQLDAKPPLQEDLPDTMKRRPFISFMEDYKRMLQDVPLPPQRRNWFRSNGNIDDDRQLLHACLLTYQSDNDLMSTARLPHKGAFTRERLQRASLDHAMWFHRPARVDQWLLYALDSPSASAARGYSRGEIFTATGEHLASTMQEGLMRKR